MPEGEFKITPENQEQVFEDAKAHLGLEVKPLEGDQNVVLVTGLEEDIQAVFGGIVAGLGGREQGESKVKEDWQYVGQGKRLRPGGTYEVTVRESEGIEGALVMKVMLANNRNHQPFLDEMHQAVRKGIIDTFLRDLEQMSDQTPMSPPKDPEAIPPCRYQKIYEEAVKQYQKKGLTNDFLR